MFDGEKLCNRDINFLKIITFFRDVEFTRKDVEKVICAPQPEISMMLSYFISLDFIIKSREIQRAKGKGRPTNVYKFKKDYNYMRKQIIQLLENQYKIKLNKILEILDDEKNND